MLHTTGDYYVCLSCIDCNGTCHCKASEYYGIEEGYLPWGGCNHFLSRRKWSVKDKKKKHKNKWPSLEEFEFGC
jgi:hypothetical protein